MKPGDDFFRKDSKPFMGFFHRSRLSFVEAKIKTSLQEAGFIMSSSTLTPSNEEQARHSFFSGSASHPIVTMSFTLAIRLQ